MPATSGTSKIFNAIFFTKGIVKRDFEALQMMFMDKGIVSLDFEVFQIMVMDKGIVSRDFEGLQIMYKGIVSRVTRP